MSDTYNDIVNLENTDLIETEDLSKDDEGLVEIDVSEVKVSRPHWHLDRGSFLTILNMIEKFPNTVPVYFCLFLHKDKDKIAVLASNKDYFVHIDLPLINKDDVFISAKDYFLKFEVLKVLVKSYKDFVFSFDDAGDVYYYNEFVNYKLETYNFTADRIMINYKNTVDWKVLSLSKNVLNNVSKMFSFSVNLIDNKVAVENDIVKGYFQLYSFDFKIKNDHQEKFLLRKLDIAVLLKALDLLGSNELFLYNVQGDRIWLKMPKGVLSFLYVPYSKLRGEIKMDNSIGDVILNLPLLKKALFIMQFFFTRVVRFESEGDNIFISSDSKTRFKIGTGKLDSVFMLALEIFRKIVSVLPIVDSIKVKIFDNGVCFEVQNAEDESVFYYNVSKLTNNIIDRQRRLEIKTVKMNTRKEGEEIKGRVDIVPGDTLKKFLEENK